MRTEPTAPTTPETVQPLSPEPPRSASITLRSADGILRLVAERKKDGRAVSYVSKTDANKKTETGMRTTHLSMDEAKDAISALAEQAQKLGWAKRAFAFKAKPDAFSTLPAVSKAVTTKAPKAKK